MFFCTCWDDHMIYLLELLIGIDWSSNVEWKLNFVKYTELGFILFADILYRILASSKIREVEL